MALKFGIEPTEADLPRLLRSREKILEHRRAAGLAASPREWPVTREVMPTFR